MKKTTSTIRNQATPILLSLFSAGLAGCSSNTTVAPTTVSGTAVKGLLKNAEAFVDTDGDGAWTSGVDSDKVRTAEDGSFSIVTDLTGDIVVQTDESTIDASSGAVLAGITMSAMAGSSVVSVATTITNELVDAATTAGNTLSQADAEAQVKAILGISATVDVASYNPYASANAGSTAAVEFEKAAQQVMTVINTLAEAEATTNIGTSVSKSAAISNAITAFVDVVEAKVVEAGTSTVASIDFTAATIIDEVVAAAVTNDSNSVFNDTNFADSLTAIKTAIKSVNTAIDSVNSLDAGSKQTFAVAQTALIDMTQSVASSNDDSKATIDINTTVEQISKMVVVNGTTSGILTEDDAKSSNDDGSLVLKGTASIIDPDTTDNVSYTFSTTVTTITSDSASGTALGSLTITSAGVWTYTVDDSHADIQALGVKDSLTEVFQVKSIATDATNPEALVTSDSATKYIQVKISGNNDAPTLSEALADTATAEDAAFTLDIPKTLITDLDSHDSHKVTASLENGDKLPDWLTLTSHSSGDNIATLAGTPVNSDVGAINITLTYSDGNAKVSDTFTLTVTNTNDAPTVAATIADQTTAEDAAFSFTIPSDTFADVDTNDTSLTITATGLPTGLTLTDGVISGTPTNAVVGDHTVTITATDSSNATVTDEMVITVTNTNDAPTVANAQDNQTATEDTSFSYTIPTNTFADVDTNDTSLTITATGLPNGLTLTDGVISGTPTNAAVGDTTVSITATDSTGASVTDQIVISVTNVNDAPTVANAQDNQTTAEDSAFSYTIPTNTFADVDTNDTSLTITATGLPTGLTLTDGVISGTPTNAVVGDHTVTITATDSSNATVTDEMVISVTNVNDAPTVVTAQTAQQTSENVAFSYTVPTGTFADVDADSSLTYSATLASGDALPTWLTFNAGTATFSGTPASSDVAVLSITVTANDGVATVSDTLALTVTENAIPTVANAQDNLTATEDSTFSYTVPANTFADADANDTNLTITAADLPDGLTFTTGVISGTPTNAAVGDTTVSIIATDTAGASITDQIVISVANTNDAPTVANELVDQTTISGRESIYTIATNSFADVDASDTLTYSVTLEGGASVPSWLVINSTTGALTANPTASDAGSISVTVTATDSASSPLTAADTFTIAVTANQTPSVTGLANQTATEDTAVSFSLADTSFADADSDSLTVTVSGEPTWLSYDADTKTFSGTPTTDSHAGTSTITVTATDASGAAGAATFDLVTSASNDAPVFSSAASLNVAANSSVATTATISDEESDTMIYTVSGTDATSFSIDASTGALSFVGVRTDMMTLLDSSGNHGAMLADNYTSTTTDGVTQVTVDLYATPASIGSEAWAAFQFEQTSSDANADMSIAIDSGIGGMYSENGGKSIWFHMSQPLNAIEAVKLGTLTIANYSASETYSLTNMAIRGGDSGTSNDSLLLANDLTLSSVTDLPNAADSYSVIVTATDSNDSSSSVSQTLAITIDAATANINSSTTTATWTGTTAADTYTIDSLAASADGGNGDNDVAKISIENHTTWDTTGGTSELVATLVDMEIIDIGNLVVSNDSTPVTIADFSTNMVIDATSAASLTAGNDSQVSIMGTTNDIVTLSGSGWAKGANSSLSSGDYASQTLDAWSDGTSTLHIDQEINILTPDIT